jgi:adenylate cyclase
MAEKLSNKELIDEVWYWYLTGENRVGFPNKFKMQMAVSNFIFDILPGAPRCFECHVPLGGVGAMIARPMGFRPSSLNPNLCSVCESDVRKEEGGAEVRLSMLFADVRGSTKLAESMSAKDFKDLIQRFYKTTTEVLVKHNAMVNRLMGDQVIGLFVPRFASDQHARPAIEAARDILKVTGHDDPAGPWIPVGVGVHTGKVYVGSVGSAEGVNEIAVLGNEANLAARLSSEAAEGEIIISQTAADSIGLKREGFEERFLSLKGISEPVPVLVQPS